MVIIKTCGGLGNQLFQYATALEVARICNDIVVFDLEFQKKDKRRFELKNLGIKEKLLPDVQKKKLAYQLQNFLLKFYKKYIAYHLNNKIIRNVFGMFGILFCDHNNPDIPSCLYKHSTVLLAGSFSNEKYFLSTIDDLRRELRVYAERNLLKKETVTVCVHIRRGDYVGNKIHEVCSDSYYYKAMDEMEKKIGKCVFMIFTDDIDYIKKQMKFKHTYIICEEKNTCKTLYYMMQCDHYIISNSTFSWWAQRLCANDKKIVIAPKYWFNTNEKCDLYNDAWIRMI